MKIKKVFKKMGQFVLDYNHYFLIDFFAGPKMMTEDEKSNLKNQNSKILEADESCAHKKYEKAISACVLLGYLMIVLSLKKCTTGSFMPEIIVPKEPSRTKIIQKGKDVVLFQKAFQGKEK